MHRSLLGALTAVPFSLLAQADSLVNSKGTYFGQRSSFLEECRGAFSRKDAALMDPDKVCTCMLDVLMAAPVVDQSSDPDALDQLDFDDLLAHDAASRKAFEACVYSGFTPAAMEEMTSECVRGLRNDRGLREAGVDAELLCRCITRQVVDHRLGPDDLERISDPNSPLFNEVMLPCVAEASEGGSVTAPTPADITGPDGPQPVPVIGMEDVHKVKVSIGGQERYFIIDSGASDCFISADFADLLLSYGAILKADRMPERAYLIADGREVKCDRFLVHGITIGPFVVDNVAVAVVDQKNVQFLLGKSALGKFSSWHVDATAMKLVLTR